jgi:chromosome segregation ATPase
MRLDIDAAEVQINQLRETISMKEDSRNKVLSSYDALANANEKLQADIAELSSRNDALHHDVVAYQNSLAQVQSALSAKEELLRNVQGDLDSLKRGRTEYLVEIEGYKTQLTQARHDLTQTVVERNKTVEQLTARVRDLEVDKLAFESQVSSEVRVDAQDSVNTPDQP